MSDTPVGTDNPGTIDDVTTAADGFVTLHVRQARAWDGSDHQALLLQEKLYNYLAFVADGELARLRPGQRTRWGVVVDCFEEPGARIQEVLRAARSQFEALGGRLDVRRRPG